MAFSNPQCVQFGSPSFSVAVIFTLTLCLLRAARTGHTDGRQGVHVRTQDPDEQEARLNLSNFDSQYYKAADLPGSPKFSRPVTQSWGTRNANKVRMLRLVRMAPLRQLEGLNPVV